MVWIRWNVGVWRQVVWLWVLNRVSPKDSEPWWVGIYPFIPSHAPSVIVNLNLIVSHFYYLSFKPLLDSVLDIKPSAYFEFPILGWKLLNVFEIIDVFTWILSLLLPKSSILVNRLYVLWFLSVFVGQLSRNQALDIIHRSLEDIEWFSLVEPYLLEIVTGVLLEDQTPIPPKDIRLIKCPHNFLNQVHVSQTVW